MGVTKHIKQNSQIYEKEQNRDNFKNTEQEQQQQKQQQLSNS